MMNSYVKEESSRLKKLLSLWPIFLSFLVIFNLFMLEGAVSDFSISQDISIFAVSFVSTLIFLGHIEYQMYVFLDRLSWVRVFVVLFYTIIPISFFIILPRPTVDSNTMIGVIAGIPFVFGICIGSSVVAFIEGAVGIVLSRLHHRIILTLIFLVLVSVAGGSMVGANLKKSGYLLEGDVPVEFGEAHAFQKSEVFLNMLSDRLYLKMKKIKTEQFLYAIFGLFVVLSIISACMKISHGVLREIYPLSVGLDKIGQGELDVRLHVRGSFEIKHLFRSFNQMAADLSIAKNMHGAFGKYVNQNLLKLIEDQDGNPEFEAVRREVTVFFADVCGFTSISENKTPEEVMDFLNRFYSYIIPIIDDYEGYLDKFIGDEVLVVFNGPKEQTDHSVRAALCAVEIQKEAARQNKDGVFKDIKGLHISIGMATGHVVAGNIGNQDQMEYTVIGDAVNLASRLTGLANKGEIIVNDENARTNEMVNEKLSPVKVKGKEERVTPFKIKI